MVTGWEKFTHELTDFEKNNILWRVVASWRKKKIGEKVTMRQMLAAANLKAVEMEWKTAKGKQYKVTGPRMRKIIHAIRVSGTIPNLIANSRGYFKTDKEVEMKRFIQSCIERANSFREVADAYRHFVENNTIIFNNNESIQSQKSA